MGLNITLQVHAFDIFHHQKLHPIFFAYIIHCYDIGMNQLCGSQCFTLKAANRIFIILEVKSQYFDGNFSIKNQIMSQKYICHAATADIANDFIAAI